MEKDFNHIRQWLEPLLAQLGLTTEQFARRCKLSRASVYFYLEDKYRPSEGIMARMCAVLSRPLEEGLRQYTPRKSGRPFGALVQTARRSRRLSL